MYRNTSSAARSPVGYDLSPQKQPEEVYALSSLNCIPSTMWLLSTTINFTIIAAPAAYYSTILA